MVPASSEEMLPILTHQHIAVVTTSFPYIGLPNKAAKQAEALMGLTGGRTWVDCATRPTLPDLVFDFGSGRQVRLTARDYLLEVWDEIYEETKCVSTFSSVDQPADYGAVLLGTPFLNGLYSVFDADRESLAFANRNRSGKS